MPFGSETKLKMSSIVKAAARLYQNSVNKTLRAYGLRYEDIIIAENPDVVSALKYIPPQE